MEIEYSIKKRKEKGRVLYKMCKREPLKINFCILTCAETYPICTLRTLRNHLHSLRFNPNYFNCKGRKEGAKDAKNLFLEVP